MNKNKKRKNYSLKSCFLNLAATFSAWLLFFTCFVIGSTFLELAKKTWYLFLGLKSPMFCIETNPFPLRVANLDILSPMKKNIL